MTLVFLSHIDNPRYELAVKECEAAILHSSTVPPIYMIPAIVGTLDQLQPMSRPPTQPPIGTTTNRACIQTANKWKGYKEEDHDFVADTEESKDEPPFIRPSDQEAEDHLSNVADGVVETRTKEEEGDHTGI